MPTTHPARPAAIAHATGRQRRDGSAPVGNSSNTNATRPRPNSQAQPSQSPSACVRAKRKNRSCPTSPAVYDRAVPHMSQPIGFAGRFHPSNAPTVAKPPMNATAITTSAGLPRIVVGSGWIALYAKSAAVVTTDNTHRDQAHQKTARALNLGPPCNRETRCPIPPPLDS